MFHAPDFELYAPRFQGDVEWNSRRLDIRHRLQEVGELVKSDFADIGIGLERRESLHHPHTTNRKRVRRQRTMLFRDKSARRTLQDILGRELGRDLNSAANNVHLQFGIDADGIWWGMRIDRGAWYDLNVLLKRAEEGEGRKEIAAACRNAPSFCLEIDRGGSRLLLDQGDKEWRELAGVLQPGEVSLDIIRRVSATEVETEADTLIDIARADFASLAPLFRLASWTPDSPSGGAF